MASAALPISGARGDRVGAGGHVAQARGDDGLGGTVAVVVPSPATSLVLVATDLTSCAGFRTGRRVDDVAGDGDTVVLVTVGPAEGFRYTTCRPQEVEVTLTVSARR